jgi:hypothetical protein
MSGILKSARIAGVFLFAGSASAAFAQLGTGWTEYQTKWYYDVPPNASAYGDRYTYQNGVFHLWVKGTDQSTFPGRDSGPRSVVRVQNEYASGDHQFEADVMVVAGSEKVGTWQLFQSPTPWMIRVYGGKYLQFGNGSAIASVTFGKYQHFNAIHSPATKKLELYLDGQRILGTTLNSDDGIRFYNKFGVYGRAGMGDMNEIYYKNVKYFSKGGTGLVTLEPRRNGVRSLSPGASPAWELFDPMGRKAELGSGLPRLVRREDGAFLLIRPPIF